MKESERVVEKYLNRPKLEYFCFWIYSFNFSFL